jgi:hypothetical protein
VVGPGSEHPSLVRGAPSPCRSDPQDGPAEDSQGLWDECQEKLSKLKQLFLMRRPLIPGVRILRFVGLCTHSHNMWDKANISYAIYGALESAGGIFATETTAVDLTRGMESQALLIEAEWEGVGDERRLTTRGRHPAHNGAMAGQMQTHVWPPERR